MKTPLIKPIFPPDLASKLEIPEDLLHAFLEIFEPIECQDVLHLFVDARTSALYFECHIRAEKLIALSTTDVPLDPEDQPEYRANRDIVSNNAAFLVMQDDAKLRRTFSNIVAEFTTEFDPETPLKIVGGQHRFEAIKGALAEGINEVHGIKVYFGLTPEQRLDAQLISNTVIAVPADLFDRMQETMHGPELRDWCQKVGLLEKGQDFADKRRRGSQLTVGAARTFILNYYAGKQSASGVFSETDTSPIICKTGVADSDWELLRARGRLWKDSKLETAGREFAALIEAQRKAVLGGKKGAVDVQEKALNYAVLAAWAYTAGLLHENATRLARHFGLKGQTSGHDPLNAAALAKGHHQSDAETYRGLGYRTDAKERGRFVELFYIQTDKGEGITGPLVDLAIKKYHAKQAILEVQSAQKKVG